MEITVQIISGKELTILIDVLFFHRNQSIASSLTYLSPSKILYIVNVFIRLQDDPPAGVSGAPTENNIMLWNAVIFG